MIIFKTEQHGSYMKFQHRCYAYHCTSRFPQHAT